MIRIILPLMICVLCLVSCAHNPKYGTTEWNMRYSGGDGSSYENAVIVKGVCCSETNVKKAIIEYLSHEYGRYNKDWIMSGEMVKQKDKYFYEAVVNKNGMMHIRFFDVTLCSAMMYTPEYLKTMPIKEDKPLPIENEPPTTPGF